MKRGPGILRLPQLPNYDGRYYDNSRNDWPHLFESRRILAVEIGYFNVIRYLDRCMLFLKEDFASTPEASHRAYGLARPLGHIAEILISEGLNICPDEASDATYGELVKLLIRQKGAANAKPLRSSLQRYFRFCVKKRWISVAPKHSRTLFQRGSTIKAKPGCDLNEGVRVAGELLRFGKRYLNHAIQFVLSAHTGLRKKEVLQLLVSDIVFADPLLGPFLKIRGKMGKFRRVPLTESLANLLRAFIEIRQAPPTALVFHTDGLPNRPFTMLQWANFRALRGDFGYRGPSFSATNFRRGLAKALTDNGMRVQLLQSLYAHDHISTTWLYIARDNELIRKMLVDFHPAYSPQQNSN
jgi:integrase/recombinase XerC